MGWITRWHLGATARQTLGRHCQNLVTTDPPPSGSLYVVAQSAGVRHLSQHSAEVSPVFGDIAAKMALAAETEIERLLNLGAPVIVDRGNGIEELNTWPSR